MSEYGRRKALMDALVMLNLSETEKILTRIFQNHSKNLSQKIVDQILQIGARFQRNHKAELSEERVKEILKGNMSKMKAQDIYDFLIEYFRRIMENIPEYKSSQYSIHIKKAMNYIRKIMRKIFHSVW